MLDVYLHPKFPLSSSFLSLLAWAPGRMAQRRGRWELLFETFPFFTQQNHVSTHFCPIDSNLALRSVPDRLDFLYTFVFTYICIHTYRMYMYICVCLCLCVCRECTGILVLKSRTSFRDGFSKSKSSVTRKSSRFGTQRLGDLSPVRAPECIQDQAQVVSERRAGPFNKIKSLLLFS